MKQNTQKKYLLFGPLPPPYHGQSVAFSIIVHEFQPSEILLVNTERFRFRICNTVYAILCTFYYFIFFRFDTVYYTSIRSRLGFIKDCVLLLLGRWTGKRIINHLHGANFHSFYQNSGLMKPLIRYCYDKISTSIVLLPGMEKEYTDFPAMKVKVIGNCYEKQFDLHGEIELKNGSRILFLSNLMKCKGIFEFLDACGSILQKYTVTNVSIAGLPYGDAFLSRRQISDQFFTKFEELKNRFSGRIGYLGVVKGADKIKLLTESDIFVLPTWHPSEAFPLSIIEAMRTGNAIITTRHNFLPEIVKPENGILVTPKSSHEIADAIEQLLQDPVKLRQIQAYNRDFAKRKYNPEKYIEAVKSVISSAPSAHPSASSAVKKD